VPILNTDLMPTLLELAGLEAPKGLDGVSYGALFRGTGEPAIRPLFWHFPHYTNQGGRPAGAVREGDWKLIEHYEDGRLELFDLAKDPGETLDVSVRQPARTAALKGKLAAWRAAVGAQENVPNPDFTPELHRQLYVDTDVSRLLPAATAAEMTKALATWRKGMDSVAAARR
jgi:arylsulfatase A-like enzyme